MNIRVCLYSPAPAFSIHELQYSVYMLEKILSLGHLDFEKIRNGAIEIFRGLGEKVIHGKNLSEKSRDTVPSWFFKFTTRLKTCCEAAAYHLFTFQKGGM
jgi:hypothetical protein